MQKNECLFCRISAKLLPADILWEDDEVTVFKDIHPKAPVHMLVIPKMHITSLAEAATEHKELLGILLLAIQKTARMLGVDEHGYRTIINTRAHGGQEVDHLHVHLLAGEPIGPMRA